MTDLVYQAKVPANFGESEDSHVLERRKRTTKWIVSQSGM